MFSLPVPFSSVDNDRAACVLFISTLKRSSKVGKRKLVKKVHKLFPEEEICEA